MSNNTGKSNNSASFEETLRSSLLAKVVSTILALLPFVNVIPTWYGSQNLPFSSKEAFVPRILWTILGVLFWIPGILIGIKWIWFDA